MNTRRCFSRQTSHAFRQVPRRPVSIRTDNIAADHPTPAAASVADLTIDEVISAAPTRPANNRNVARMAALL
jgi:hypothetical protein